MKVRIEFPREVCYYEKDLTLLLMQYFTPMVFKVLSTAGWGSSFEIEMERALPINPYEAMEKINEAMSRKVKGWSYIFSIRYMEMETPEERDKIATWILVDKIS